MPHRMKYMRIAISSANITAGNWNLVIGDVGFNSNIGTPANRGGREERQVPPFEELDGVGHHVAAGTVPKHPVSESMVGLRRNSNQCELHGGARHQQHTVVGAQEVS